MMKTALGIGIVLLLAMSAIAVLLSYQIDANLRLGAYSWADAPLEAGLTEAQKRESLLMPKVDSPQWKQWVSKYGDTAESWELFTLTFHTKYLGQVDARLAAIEKALRYDPNDPHQKKIHDYVMANRQAEPNEP